MFFFLSLTERTLNKTENFKTHIKCLEITIFQENKE